MKEKTKKYLRNLGIAYLFAILGLTFKYCRNDKINDFYTLTNETLSSGDVEIYDENMNKLGNLEYINQKEGILLSIKGNEINGKLQYFEESYHYNSIEYEKVFLVLKQYGDDYYYFYDTGKSVLLLCLLQPWFTNHTPIKKLSIEKDNKWGFKKEKQVFMLVEADYNKYEYVLKNIKPTIQEPFGTDIGWGQLYRCFFVQEE